MANAQSNPSDAPLDLNKLVADRIRRREEEAAQKVAEVDEKAEALFDKVKDRITDDAEFLLNELREAKMACDNRDIATLEQFVKKFERDPQKAVPASASDVEPEQSPDESDDESDEPELDYEESPSFTAKVFETLRLFRHPKEEPLQS